MASPTSTSASSLSLASSVPISPSSPSATTPFSPSSSQSLPISTSSALPSSSSAVPTSSPPPSSSSTTVAPASSTILTTPSTTSFQSTITTTSNGQTITTFVQTTSTISAGTTITPSSSTAKQPVSHTGAIVGGVIGGLAFLGLLAGGFLWYRRRSRYKSEFDGNFDPAVVSGTRPISTGSQMLAAHTTGGTLPRMNIDEDDDDGMGGRLPHGAAGGGIITPFTYAPSVSGYGSSRSQSPPMPSGSPPPMSQYSHDGYPSTLSSAGGYYTAVPQQPQAIGGHYPPATPSSSSSSTYNPQSAKEREVLGARGAGLAVANPSHENESRFFSGSSYDEQYQAYLRAGPQNARSSSPPISPTTSSSGPGQRSNGGVLVHQDGGRVEPAETVREEADEIPPTYDSLPSGERK
ncbi:hypothetical protein DFH07DRAFT_826743 [Mycena maculata]|uniref:Uncharacterized protein n=1 Tax=Mycena maculata TaxID=230809 RepID=A0AAD7IWM1_9AGAR|nr:hypothetical protein DFH07DRAFT_826743 [Mycena maculata]